VSDATLLVAGRDEQLLDHDRPAFLAAQGDVAGRLTLLAGDEDQIAVQNLEYSLVAPAGQTDKRALREPEQLRQVSLDPRSDLDLGSQRAPPSAPTPARRRSQLEPRRILQPHGPPLANVRGAGRHPLLSYDCAKRRPLFKAHESSNRDVSARAVIGSKDASAVEAAH
jgi:hypothetical protein